MAKSDTEMSYVATNKMFDFTNWNSISGDIRHFMSNLNTGFQSYSCYHALFEKKSQNDNRDEFPDLNEYILKP